MTEGLTIADLGAAVSLAPFDGRKRCQAHRWGGAARQAAEVEAVDHPTRAAGSPR